MRYLYLDESGDLSFNLEITKRHFVVSAVVCGDKKITDRIIKKSLLAIKNKDRVKRSGQQLHAKDEKDVTKRRVMRNIASSGIKSFSIIFDKYEKPGLSQVDKIELYTTLLIDVILSTKVNGECEVYLSRCYTRKSINEKIEKDVTVALLKNDINATVVTRMHHRMSGLQVVDFVAHAVYNKCEYQDESMYKIISKNDKTLAAFAECHTAPMRQGNYLPCPKYSKSKHKSQVKKEGK